MQAGFQSGDVKTTRATDRPPTERVSFLTGIRRQGEKEDKYWYQSRKMSEAWCCKDGEVVRRFLKGGGGGGR